MQAGYVPSGQYQNVSLYRKKADIPAIEPGEVRLCSQDRVDSLVRFTTPSGITFVGSCEDMPAACRIDSEATVERNTLPAGWDPDQISAYQTSMVVDPNDLSRSRLQIDRPGTLFNVSQIIHANGLQELRLTSTDNRNQVSFTVRQTPEREVSVEHRSHTNECKPVTDFREFDQGKGISIPYLSQDLQVGWLLPPRTSTP